MGCRDTLEHSITLPVVKVAEGKWEERLGSCG